MILELVRGLLSNTIFSILVLAYVTIRPGVVAKAGARDYESSQVACRNHETGRPCCSNGLVGPTTTLAMDGVKRPGDSENERLKNCEFEESRGKKGDRGEKE